jgi:hypothetical protein
MREHRPNFLFVCDHGRGDKPDRVALLPWLPDRDGWWGAEGVDQAAIAIWPMEGNTRGWNPKWLRPGVDTGPDDVDHRRFAIEISCRVPGCQKKYRSPDEKLQTLLTKIATDGNFRTKFVERADESTIEMTLDKLRDSARHADNG